MMSKMRRATRTRKRKQPEDTAVYQQTCGYCGYVSSLAAWWYAIIRQSRACVRCGASDGIITERVTKDAAMMKE